MSVSPRCQKASYPNWCNWPEVYIFCKYGMALTVVLRHDLMVDFSRLLIEITKYVEDGINIMIDNGWLQEPPKLEVLKNLH